MSLQPEVSINPEIGPTREQIERRAYEIYLARGGQHGQDLADDNAPARQVMRVALERAGLTVCAEAADGLDAVDKASELKPDLIVLDLRLPRLNGIEAAHVLRGRLPNTPIVLFTMFDVAPSL